jgi:SAM-dependent methyltransferase
MTESNAAHNAAPTAVRRLAPATGRNREPILSVLARVLPSTGTVLEIASGTGQHAVFFADALPGVQWLPSDPDAASRASIDAWRKHAGSANVAPARALDVMADVWPMPPVVDAIVCINMIHIAPWAAAEALFEHARRDLAEGGILFLYGPYRRDGAHTSPSNAAFDTQLRATDPEWGIRELEAVSALGAKNGFALDEIVPMPANNFSLVFRRCGA